MEKLNVAIADDNERIVEMLNALIRTENDMEVVGTAGNGEDAVEMIKKSAPDVVLLDLIMPKMDGLGVLEKLKTDPAVRKMPAFIVLSAIGQEAVTEDAFALGANYYIMKPFNNEMLLGRLRSIRSRGEKVLAPAGQTAERRRPGFPEERDLETDVHQHDPRDWRACPYQGLSVSAGRDYDVGQGYGDAGLHHQGAVPRRSRKTIRLRQAAWSGRSATPSRWPGAAERWTPSTSCSAIR